MRVETQGMAGRSPLQTIIVGVDGDEGGRDALALASRLQWTFPSRVIAVLSNPGDEIPSRGSSPAYEASMRDEARRTLLRELAHAAVVAEPEVVSAPSPQRGLHEAAKAHDAQLIVVGAGRHGRLARRLGRDVTAATLRRAPCPVSVAQRRAGTMTPPLRTIAVGSDGSPQSRAALEFARELAGAAGARLQLLWVVPASVPVGPWTSRAVAMTAGERRLERDRARALMAETVDALGDNAIGDTAPGVAHEELAQLCREADLLVVGSRGEGALGRALRGSTSMRLVREAPCPVLVVPADFTRSDPLPADAATVERRKAA
jgi:nucleotide-binding universal stress UspA family protein